MNEILIICLLWIGFSVITKWVDLIDEHKWITWKIGFITKYLFVFAANYIVFLSIWIDKNLIPYFFAVLLFWLLNNKLEYPSHVLFAFNTGILIGLYINNVYIISGTIGLIVYGCIEYLVKKYKHSFIQKWLYKSLVRFLIVPLGLSIYFSDYNIILFVIPWIISIQIIRYLIGNGIIKISDKK